MKTKLKVLWLSLIAIALNACSSPLPRSVVIGDLEISLLGGIIFLLLLGAVFFFLFVWPIHQPASKDSQEQHKPRA